MSADHLKTLWGKRKENIFVSTSLVHISCHCVRAILRCQSVQSGTVSSQRLWICVITKQAAVSRLTIVCLWYHGTFQKHFGYSIQTSLAYSKFSGRLKQNQPLLPINNLQGFYISQRPMFTFYYNKMAPILFPGAWAEVKDKTFSSPDGEADWHWFQKYLYSRTSQ